MRKKEELKVEMKKRGKVERRRIAYSLILGIRKSCSIVVQRDLSEWSGNERTSKVISKVIL